MEIGLLLKIAGIALLVSVSCLILSRAGREEQATLVSLAGIVIVLLLLVGEIGTLVSDIREVFGL